MRIIIKIGTSTLTDKTGKLNTQYISSFAKEITHIKKTKKVIVSGLGDRIQMKNLLQKFGNNITLTNTVVSMKTNYYHELKNKKWAPSKRPQKELFAYNMYEYCKELGISLLSDEQ
jgi:isopentenyl phosphate kinase